MTSDKLMMATAARIPAGIRKGIIEEGFIDKAVNLEIENSPMQYLFDVYIEFLDAANDAGNWNCFKCREKVLMDFRRLKPYLMELNNA